MVEEFHGDRSAEPWQYKLLYGWGTLNTNVWVPSYIELVGIDLNHYNVANDCYFSAMQGITASAWGCVDPLGGTQFAYFQQYNATGGGTRIWNACNQQQSWLRSPSYGHINYVWRIISDQKIDWAALTVTTAAAVHPAVLVQTT